MAGIIERSYGRVIKSAFWAINPIKKMIMKTECRVHIFLDNQALIILRNDGNVEAYNFFKKYIDELNLGVVWADQDLKSRNHFYSPEREKGLYGSSNALKECISYYTAALTYYGKGEIKKSMFFLGSACHLTQDMTVPQHVNVNLLKYHRKYEQWVKRMYMQHDRFICYDGGIYLDSVKDFIENNASVAINAYRKYRKIENLERRFFNITDTILCQAQRSTCGVLNMFYKDIMGMRDTGVKSEK